VTKRKSTVTSLIETVAVIAVAGILALLIQAFVVKPYRIPSSSMEPTLTIGQRVLVDRIGKHLGGGPHVGQIVVFHPPLDAQSEVCGGARPDGAACDQPQPQEATDNFIKRIVAGPGDVISIDKGHVIRNGQREKDPYTRPCPPDSQCDFHTKIKIPPGMWFMMGDNRGQSDDSRFWGPVPTKWIIGDAFATYWPPDRIGTL
jgi:signal peptidase I